MQLEQDPEIPDMANLGPEGQPENQAELETST
jgi:hypothetical protein